MKIALDNGGSYLEPDEGPRDSRFHKRIIATSRMHNTIAGHYCDLECGHRVITFGDLRHAAGVVLCTQCRDNEVRCHCGRPLHYSDPQIQAQVEALIRAHGEYVKVTVPESGRCWLVQRHYIGLHGLIAEELPYLGFEEIEDVRQG